MSELGEFPVNEPVLLALEHAMGGCLTFDRPEDAPDDGGPWLIGAEYSMHTLLDFLAGCMGEDPNGIIIDPGEDVDPNASWAEKMRGARVVEDTRIHYSEFDVIRALINEVRRLRAEGYVQDA